MLTGYPNTINVIRNDTRSFNNFIKLGTCTMEDDWIKSNAVQKAKTSRKFIQFTEDSAPDLDNSEFGRLRWVC